MSGLDMFILYCFRISFFFRAITDLVYLLSCGFSSPSCITAWLFLNWIYYCLIISRERYIISLSVRAKGSVLFLYHYYCRVPTWSRLMSLPLDTTADRLGWLLSIITKIEQICECLASPACFIPSSSKQSEDLRPNCASLPWRCLLSTDRFGKLGHGHDIGATNSCLHAGSQAHRPLCCTLWILCSAHDSVAIPSN